MIDKTIILTLAFAALAAAAPLPEKPTFNIAIMPQSAEFDSGASLRALAAPNMTGVNITTPNDPVYAPPQMLFDPHTPEHNIDAVVIHSTASLHEALPKVFPDLDGNGMVTDADIASSAASGAMVNCPVEGYFTRGDNEDSRVLCEVEGPTDPESPPLLPRLIVPFHDATTSEHRIESSTGHPDDAPPPQSNTLYCHGFRCAIRSRDHEAGEIETSSVFPDHTVQKREVVGEENPPVTQDDAGELRNRMLVHPGQNDELEETMSTAQAQAALHHHRPYGHGPVEYPASKVNGATVTEDESSKLHDRDAKFHVPGHDGRIYEREGGMSVEQPEAMPYHHKNGSVVNPYDDIPSVRGPVVSPTPDGCIQSEEDCWANEKH